MYQSNQNQNNIKFTPLFPRLEVSTKKPRPTLPPNLLTSRQDWDKPPLSTRIYNASKTSASLLSSLLVTFILAFFLFRAFTAYLPSFDELWRPFPIPNPIPYHPKNPAPRPPLPYNPHTPENTPPYLGRPGMGADNPLAPDIGAPIVHDEPLLPSDPLFDPQKVVFHLRFYTDLTRKWIQLVSPPKVGYYYHLPRPKKPWESDYVSYYSSLSIPFDISHPSHFPAPPDSLFLKMSRAFNNPNNHYQYWVSLRQSSQKYENLFYKYLQFFKVPFENNCYNLNLNFNNHNLNQVDNKNNNEQTNNQNNQKQSLSSSHSLYSPSFRSRVSRTSFDDEISFRGTEKWSSRWRWNSPPSRP